ncbi:hypothetical protein BBK36DRAFT_1111079 [Trichoderma citrinoviride]|uniref:Zn(2)-C6 fungal-type domain-containing protein n=1 Tax=Trichoderma citrinoviride TaxID=58853 RepID=A0A2T4BJX1_9HYPO|nr:hypothetical protein BBK36DRAFT_1111079 [Trichoderma citrinoviride]PTB69605.1 hypothetical protein BBK36DRAFT_1111079 [Trichoderma citrinoviride]
MSEIKRRTRTGCLTCRARRVKCDEQKPACNRCVNANVECAGYAPKRRIDVRPPGQRQRASQSRSHGPPSFRAASSPAADAAACAAPPPPLPRPQFRHDGLPLVGLPSNPRLSTRPCAAAREVLAYHQVFFRTLPMLFPANHLWFWRDRLCDEAWCIEYAQRGLLALGCMHRAALMTSMFGEYDQARGLDTKVIGVQEYTQALQELSSHIREAQKSPGTLSAVMILMAYFECFASNIPAAYGHVRAAKYYYTKYVRSYPPHCTNPTMEALETALQTLSWTCYMAVPLPGMLLTDNGEGYRSSMIDDEKPLSLRFLETLVDYGIHSEIWSTAPTQQEPSALLKNVYRFQKELRQWLEYHVEDYPYLETDTTALANLEADGECHYPIPPSPFLALSSELCFTGALYNFIMARVSWTLCLYDKSQDAKKLESEAYMYFYQAMRFAATYAMNTSKTLPNTTYSTNTFVTSEELDRSFLPMLYIIGQCSPRPSWLRWIAQLMKQIGEQGLFNGFVLSASLQVFHKMEQSHNLLSTDGIERYPSPALRIISTLIPETNAQGFVCFYAKPSRFNSGWANRDVPLYYPVAQARFSTELDDDNAAKREIEMYDEQRSMEEQFTSGWILGRPVASGWKSRFGEVGFDLDHVLHDHINGGRLLPMV